MASKSRRNKATFKWTKELIFLIAFVSVLIVVTIVLAIPSSAKRTLNKYNEAITAYNSANSTSYQTLAADNVFEEIGGGYDQQVSNVMSIAGNNKYTYVFYGALTDSAFLEQLSAINTLAKEYEVKKVYVFLANYVADAEKNSETATITFNNKINEYNTKLNAGKDPNCEKFDMTLHPALLVYKDGKLLFNTQVDTDSKYTWSQYINKAFGFEQGEKNSAE